LEGRFRYVNQAAAALAGYSAEELVGKPLREFIGETMTDPELYYQRYEQRLEGQEAPTQYEARIRRRDGSMIDVIMSVTAIRMGG
ncbi:MAG: PAS domain S-box protein, partial [Gammaproteobacteria bacterium]|nr:PAS domain S-box protein [Gammaproteobacteria bacterium]NIV20226.1 PAS domain S-box protein [Gammaproteobacteria bacterium]